MVLGVGRLYRELLLARSRWNGRRELRWPELDGNKLTAAAGVRAGAGTRLQRSSEQAEWRGILLEAPGACQCPWSEQKRLGNAGSPAMADGGLG